MYLYGASGHGKVVLEIAEELDIEVNGFIDSNCELKDFLGYNILGNSGKTLNGECTISIGNNKVRKLISEYENHLQFISLISKQANISKRAIIHDGTVIMKGVSINCDAVIGKHCIINTNSSIDHDCKIGDFVHISPNVALAGNVEVNEGSHIGIGSSVIQGIKIGKWCTIGAGSVIIEDIPDFAVVVGVPGKVIKYNI